MEVKPMNKRQEREVRFASIQVREENQADDKYFVLEGTPIVLENRTCLGKGWGGEDIFEEISVDAFDDADLSDVVFNVNHGDGNHAVARTRNQTLELTIDKENKKVNCKVLLDKSNPRCEQVYKDIASGLLDRMSFAFTIEEESFNQEENCYHVRKVKKVYDVSAVEFPAYEDTSISARRHDLAVAEREAAVAEEVKREKAKAVATALIDITLGGK